MTAPRYNGQAAPDLKAQAEQLRGVHQRANGTDRLHPDVDEVYLGGTRYFRYPDGIWRDEGRKVFDPANFIIPVEPEQDEPWLHALEPFTALNFTTLADTPAIQRDWAVPDWFPMLETIGFGGPAGEGKTTIAQLFGTASALGRSVLGMSFEQMKATLVLCEDRHDDAYLRQVDINRALGCTMKDLAGNLKILPRRQHKHNYLGIFDDDGVLHTTSFFDQLLGELKAFGSKFTVLDPRADVFWGNQNDERHARRFVRDIIDRIAEETDGLCLMLYQPSRSGRQDGTGESGSVQWDAAFRASILLEGAKKDEDPRCRRLVRKKSNFSAKDVEIEMQWHQGVFVRTEEIAAATPQYEISARRMKAERVFLSMLDLYNKQNINVSSSPSAQNYAPKRFVAHQRQAEGCTKEELTYAMNILLFDKSLIAIEQNGRFKRLVQVVRAGEDTR